MTRLTPEQKAEADRIHEEVMRDVRGRVRGALEATTKRMIQLSGRNEVAEATFDHGIDLHLETFGKIATVAQLRAIANRIESGER